jgi:hypothetical protein
VQFVGTYLAGFPDWRIVVDDQIAEGVTYSKISDGQVHESWASWDTLSMLQQLGAVPEPAPTKN